MPKSEPTTAAPCPCGEPAVRTEFSPYMDDYCDACTAVRCDIASGSECPNKAQDEPCS